MIGFSEDSSPSRGREQALANRSTSAFIRLKLDLNNKRSIRIKPVAGFAALPLLLDHNAAIEEIDVENHPSPESQHAQPSEAGSRSQFSQITINYLFTVF